MGDGGENLSIDQREIAVLFTAEISYKTHRVVTLYMSTAGSASERTSGGQIGGISEHHESKAPHGQFEEVWIFFQCNYIRSWPVRQPHLPARMTFTTNDAVEPSGMNGYKTVNIIRDNQIANSGVEIFVRIAMRMPYQIKAASKRK